MTDLEMAPIFPVTALAKNPKQVRDAARKSVVRVTENGCGAFVFMSEDALRDLVRREREDAAYEVYVQEAVGRGVADIAAGRFVDSRVKLFAEAKRRRDARA